MLFFSFSGDGESGRMEKIGACVVEVVSYHSDSDKWNLPLESGKKLYLCWRNDFALKNDLLKVRVAHNRANELMYQVLGCGSKGQRVWQLLEPVGDGPVPTFAIEPTRKWERSL